MDFRVPMVEMEVTVAMTETEPLVGVIFLSPYSHRHEGFETVDEYLNGDRAFFPMTMGGVSKLVNRDQILWLRAPRYPGEVAYAAAEADVILEMIDGMRVEGMFEIARPIGQARISDVLNNDRDRFVSLRDGDESYYANKRFIRQVILR
ncbi:MAG: hypothetical protein ACSLFQ_05925 [Thermoanaerobaculia bacterium]